MILIFECELSFICSNIPAVPTYGVYPFQLIQYYKACGTYHNFLEKRVPPNRQATKPRVPSGEVEVITLWLIIVFHVYHCDRCVFNVYQCYRCVRNVCQWFFIVFNVGHCY